MRTISADTVANGSPSSSTRTAPGWRESGVSAVTVGPARGSLVIVGGGAVGEEIYDRFIDLAGGVDAPIVVIPTAGENDEVGEGVRVQPQGERR